MDYRLSTNAPLDMHTVTSTSFVTITFEPIDLIDDNTNNEYQNVSSNSLNNTHSIETIHQKCIVVSAPKNYSSVFSNDVFSGTVGVISKSTQC